MQPVTSPFLFSIRGVDLLELRPSKPDDLRQGQLRIRVTIGSGERVFDILGMAVEKHLDVVLPPGRLGVESGGQAGRAWSP
jgi:hypothetical protein